MGREEPTRRRFEAGANVLAGVNIAAPTNEDIDCFSPSSIRQLNVVYEVEEDRSFLRLRGVAVLLALAFFVLMVAAVSLAKFGGMLQSYLGDRLGWSQVLVVTFAALRWIVIVFALHLAFSLVYYLGPNMKHPFKLLTPGSVAATAALLLAEDPTCGMTVDEATDENFPLQRGALRDRDRPLEEGLTFTPDGFQRLPLALPVSSAASDNTSSVK